MHRLKNNKKYLYTIFVCILLIVTYILWGFIKIKKENQRDFPEIQKSNTLKVVTNFDPIGYYPDGDSIKGYTKDLLDHIENISGLKIEVSLENSLEKCYEGLESGKYDIIARNINIQNDIKKRFNFTDPILYNKLVLVQRKSEYNDSISPIRNRLDLARKTIQIPSNSPIKTRIKNLATEIGDSIYIKEDNLYSSNELMILVASKEIDYTVCDFKTANQNINNFPELDINTDIGFTHLEGWVVNKKSIILLDSLNQWIKESKDFKNLIRQN